MTYATPKLILVCSYQLVKKAKPADPFVGKIKFLDIPVSLPSQRWVNREEFAKFMINKAASRNKPAIIKFDEDLTSLVKDFAEIYGDEGHYGIYTNGPCASGYSCEYETETDEVEEKKMQKIKIKADCAWVFNFYNGRIEKVHLHKNGDISYPKFDDEEYDDDDYAADLIDFMEDQCAVDVKSEWVFLNKESAKSYRQLYVYRAAMHARMHCTGEDYKFANKVKDFLEQGKKLKNKHFNKKIFNSVVEFFKTYE